MGWIILAAIVLVIAIIAYTTAVQKAKWKTIYEENGLSDEASNRYAFLQEHNIRSRLRQVPIRSASTADVGVGSVASMTDDMSQQKVKLEVHKEDFDKAKALMQEYVPPSATLF